VPKRAESYALLEIILCFTKELLQKCLETFGDYLPQQKQHKSIITINYMSHAIAHGFSGRWLKVRAKHHTSRGFGAGK
jgi:hypothetical protein